jgi:hypothetical protein
MAQFQKITGSAAVGGDVGQLRTFATVANNVKDELQQVLAKIDTEMSKTTWSGADATAFEGVWAERSTALKNQITSILEDVNAKATKQAQDQEGVSAN